MSGQLPHVSPPQRSQCFGPMLWVNALGGKPMAYCPPVLSAAALRKRLLEKQASRSAADSSGDNSGVASPDNGPNPPGVSNKTAVKYALSKERSRTAEEVLLGDAGTVDETALYEATETVDEPPKKRIQLSSVSADSSIIQHKPDGTAVLRFADSSEVRSTVCSWLAHHADGIAANRSSRQLWCQGQERRGQPMRCLPLSFRHRPVGTCASLPRPARTSLRREVCSRDSLASRRS